MKTIKVETIKVEIVFLGNRIGYPKNAWGLQQVSPPLEVYHYEVGDGDNAKSKLKSWARENNCTIVQ
jgi:hypothetical protein